MSKECNTCGVIIDSNYCNNCLDKSKWYPKAESRQRHNSEVINKLKRDTKLNFKVMGED